MMVGSYPDKPKPMILARRLSLAPQGEANLELPSLLLQERSPIPPEH